MKVSEIMNKAYVADGSISMKEAAKIMSEKNVGCLIVMKGDKILGIVTERDVIKNIGQLGSKISSVMTKSVITVDASDNIDNAAVVLAKNRIKKLPVLKKGKLAGIITATDIIAHSEDINEEFFIE